MSILTYIWVRLIKKIITQVTKVQPKKCSFLLGKKGLISQY